MDDPIFSKAPIIPMKLDPQLLSHPIFGFDSNYFLKIANWIKDKFISGKFRRHPTQKILLMVKYKEFMELYERAKVKEGEAKEKAGFKTRSLFYRPRLADRNDQRLFKRLDNRRKSSERMRKHNQVS